MVSRRKLSLEHSAQRRNRKMHQGNISGSPINTPWLKSACSYIGWDGRASCLSTPQMIDVLLLSLLLSGIYQQERKMGGGYNSQRFQNSFGNSEQWRRGCRLWTNPWVFVWWQGGVLEPWRCNQEQQKHLDQRYKGDKWGGENAPMADLLLFQSGNFS